MDEIDISLWRSIEVGWKERKVRNLDSREASSTRLECRAA